MRRLHSDGLVVILYGDVPLLRRETLAALVAQAERSGGLAMLTALVNDPAGYGRIVRDARGNIQGVVEDKDADRGQRDIKEVNAGIYAAPAEFLREAVGKLSARNAQAEYYLTDIVARAADSIGVTSVEVAAEEMAGVNDRAQLVAAERLLHRSLGTQAQQSGDLPLTRPGLPGSNGHHRARRRDWPQRGPARPDQGRPRSDHR